MQKVALIVTLEYKPESKASFLQALFSHQQRCLQTEPGTLQFEILNAGEGTNSVVLFEFYANEEALSMHDAGPSLALFKEQAGAFITKASGQRCAVMPVPN
jgi:autoinducer 2-degrading protein